MSQEIIYTSAPSGLKPGSRGFCTVVATRGMAKNLADHLEDLSGYRHLFTGGATGGVNPVAYSHLKTTVGGRSYHILSRIGDAGLDYTQRTNKLAHHVALDPQELPPDGPAALLAAPGFMTSSWSGQPQVRDAGPAVPRVESLPAVCHAWQRLTGDAGWGGVLAAELAGDSRRPIVMIYRPGTDVLGLIVESLALLPASKRRQATFSTYVTKLSPTIDCRWRCYVEGTPEAESAVRQAGALIVDLRKSLGSPQESPYVDAARTGKPPRVAAPSIPVNAVAVAADDALLAALMEDDDVRPTEKVPTGATPRPIQEAFDLGPPPVRAASAEWKPREAKRLSPRSRFSPAMLIVIGAAGLLLLTGIGFTANYLIANRSQSITAELNEHGTKTNTAIPSVAPTPTARLQGETKETKTVEPPKLESPGTASNDQPKAGNASDGDIERKPNGSPAESEPPKHSPPDNKVPASPTSDGSAGLKAKEAFHFLIVKPTSGRGANPFADKEPEPTTDMPSKLISNHTLTIDLLRRALSNGKRIEFEPTTNPDKSVLSLVLIDPNQKSETIAKSTPFVSFRIGSKGLMWTPADALTDDEAFTVLQHSVLTAIDLNESTNREVIRLRRPTLIAPVQVQLNGNSQEIKTGFDLQPDKPLNLFFKRDYKLTGPMAPEVEFKCQETHDSFSLKYGDAGVCTFNITLNKKSESGCFDIKCVIEFSSLAADAELQRLWQGKSRLITGKTLDVDLKGVATSIQKDRDLRVTEERSKGKDKDARLKELDGRIAEGIRLETRLKELREVVSVVEGCQLLLTLSIRVRDDDLIVPVAMSKP